MTNFNSKAKIKLDMCIFKNYFLLMKEILSFKAIDENGNEQNAFYLSSLHDIDIIDRDELNSKREVDEALKLIIPFNNTTKEYMQENLCLNRHFYAKNVSEITAVLRINENIAYHNYHLINFVEEIINNSPKSQLCDYGIYKKYTQFRKENTDRLKELSNKIDNYNAWLYDYKMKHYFNDDYKIIHELSLNEKFDVEKLYKIIKSNYKRKSFGYSFYSFCVNDFLVRRKSYTTKDLFIGDLQFITDKEKIYRDDTINLPYKPYAIVKNKDNSIGILFTVYSELMHDDKYKENEFLIENISNHNGIVAELIISDNKKLINYNEWE